MDEFDGWLMQSEAASRFYRSVVDLEDKWKWLKLTRFRYIQWKIGRLFEELPPICHNRYSYD
jgi:hypothetical protein